MEKIPFSVLILARNEAAHIKRAVESVGFAQEIIVIDGGSTDATESIARAAGARVVVRPWTGFRDQRNFSLECASHEWVLVLDADEAVTAGLASWLRNFFASAARVQAGSGFKLRRIEYFLGKEIRGTCWNPSYQDRFFRRADVRYVGEIHEYPEGAANFQRAPEAAAIAHNPRVTVESLLEKMNRYTTVEAWQRFHQGERTNLVHIAFAGFANAWKNFFYYRGYQDGAYGFLLSLLEGVSRTVRHIKLWQIQRLANSPERDLLVQAEQAMHAGAALHRRLEAEGHKI